MHIQAVDYRKIPYSTSGYVNSHPKAYTNALKQGLKMAQMENKGYILILVIIFV